MDDADVDDGAKAELDEVAASGEATSAMETADVLNAWCLDEHTPHAPVADVDVCEVLDAMLPSWKFWIMLPEACRCCLLWRRTAWRAADAMARLPVLLVLAAAMCTTAAAARCGGVARSRPPAVMGQVVESRKVILKL